jgi:hypothetical protein
MFIVVLGVFSIYPALLRWKSIPFELYTFMFIFVIAFGGTSLVSADTRQFSPLVPLLLLWLAYVYTRIIQIKIRPGSEIMPT